MNKYIWRFAQTITPYLGFIALSYPTFAFAEQQPQKFLVVEPAVDTQWIEKHGKEYRYVWESRNDGKTASAWRQYAPNTILSSYFPYMRDPESAPPESWQRSHPDWILYQCDGKKIAFQFGHPIIPLNIGNEEVARWQIKNFLSRWQSDIGLDNFQMGGREHFCGYKTVDGEFHDIYSGPNGVDRLNRVKLNWLRTAYQEMHRANKTLTINYSLDVPPDSDVARQILASTDGMIYEDYWGAPYAKGIYSSDKRMLDMIKFFALAASMNKSVYFIFQLPHTDKRSVQTAMATYFINAGRNTAVYVTSPQRYGIVPDFNGYDRPVGEACGPAFIRSEFLIRHFSRAEVVLRLPNAPVATFKLGESGYMDVDGNALPETVELEPATGLIAYKAGEGQCTAS